MPSLTIITAVRNNVAFIGAALRSAISQDVQDKELVVIDGGSRDGTIDEIMRYRREIATFVSEPDRGIYDALNKGIARANGDVIAFLHSDDLFDAPDAASTLLRVFEDETVDAAYGNLLYVDREDPSTPIRNWRSRPYSRFDLWTGWMPPHPAFFMRRECYLKWGGFSTDFRIAGDYDALLRYLSVHRARAIHVDRTIVRMRTGGISNRSLRSLIRKSREDAVAMTRNGILPFPAIALKPARKISQFWSVARSANRRAA